MQKPRGTVVRTIGEADAAFADLARKYGGGRAPDVTRKDGITKIRPAAIPRGMVASDGRLLPKAQARRMTSPIGRPRGAARPRGARRPRIRRRTSSGSRSSGSDPGSSEGDGPSPAARYTFACLTAEQRGAVVA